MSKRLVVSLLVVLAGLALAAVAAAAGGSIESSSESKTLQPQTTAKVSAKCPKGTNPIAAGFDGIAQGSFSEGNAKASYTIASRLSGSSAEATAVGSGVKPSKYGASAYCRDQGVKEISKKVSIPGGLTRNVTAKCPSGRTAISGGFRGDLFMGQPVAVAVGSYRSSAREWTVSFITTPAEEKGSSVTAYAYCAKADPLKIRRTKATLRPGSGSIQTKDVSIGCRDGERVVSGGFRPALRANPGNGPITVDSRRTSSREWQVSSVVLSINAKLRAFAYCEEK